MNIVCSPSQIIQALLFCSGYQYAHLTRVLRTQKLASWSALSSEMVGMLDKEAAKLQQSEEKIATKQSELAATALCVAEAVKQQEVGAALLPTAVV